MYFTKPYNKACQPKSRCLVSAICEIYHWRTHIYLHSPALTCWHSLSNIATFSCSFRICPSLFEISDLRLDLSPSSCAAVTWYFSASVLRALYCSKSRERSSSCPKTTSYNQETAWLSVSSLYHRFPSQLRHATHKFQRMQIIEI